MGAELLLMLSLFAVAVLLLLELYHWWRPLAPRDGLKRRLKPEPRRPARRPPPYSVQAVVLGLSVGALFFLLTANALFGLVIGAVSLGGALYQLPRYRRRQLAINARSELQIGLGQLVVALRAGHSLATALQEWPESLAQALGPGKWVLLPLAVQLRQDLGRGATPEEALAAMADQTTLEEMRMLAQVIKVCRQRGGDLSLVVSQAAQTLAETLEVKAQMQSLTAGKRAEGLVITFLPPVMLLVITLSSPSYAAPLIQTSAGRFILALALLMEAVSFLVSGWLLQGEV